MEKTGPALIALLALSLLLLGCSSEHHTEVQLPNGVICKSDTSGSFLWRRHNISCTDPNGKVIGSYQSY
jgi:major membrane immunogen (membrane-anchored lipoprotein)